jgi:hypothetical protein
MRKRTFWASAVTTAALALGLITAPIQVAAVPAAATLASAPAVATAGPSQQFVDQLAAQLPAAREQAAAGRARLGLEDSALREAAPNLIDPTQYECPTANPPVLDAAQVLGHPVE